MRLLGLIGGLSWESTRLYYDAINRAAAHRLGGLHSAEITIASLDFAPIALAQSEGRWGDAGAVMVRAAQSLERAGVDAIAIASNTMHKCADAVTVAVDLPLLHIVDALSAALNRDGRTRPLLLGTRFTMEDDFVRARLSAAGIEAMIPEAADRETVNRIIYDELIKGDVRDESQAAYLEIIRRGAVAGADGVILGCTDIGMIVNAGNSALPVYDTMALHSEALVGFMLGE